MKTLMKTVPAFALLLIITFIGCKKENIGNSSSNNTIENGYMSVKMTESSTNNGLATSVTPYNITALNIDISSVEILYANEKEHPGCLVKLNTRAGIYDLLTLQNNIMTTIADDTQLSPGNITQIRLILGQDNSVLISGDSQHRLTVPSREIKIDLDTFIKEKKHLVVTLGFDAFRSVVEEDNGTFTLKPQITIKSIITN